MTNLNPVPPAPRLPANDQRAFDSIKWPAIIVGMLMIHVTLMMAGLVAALTIPAAVETSESYETLLNNQQPRVVLEQPSEGQP